jgi:hypothetical protein
VLLLGGMLNYLIKPKMFFEIICSLKLKRKISIVAMKSGDKKEVECLFKLSNLKI